MRFFTKIAIFAHFRTTTIPILPLQLLKVIVHSQFDCHANCILKRYIQLIQRIRNTELQCLFI